MSFARVSYGPRHLCIKRRSYPILPILSNHQKIGKNSLLLAAGLFVKRVALNVSALYLVKGYLPDDAHLHELLKVALDGGRRHLEASLKLPDRVHRVGIVRIHLDHLRLALIKSRNTEIGSGGLALFYLSLQVALQVAERQPEHPQMVGDEIADIHAVRLRAEERFLVGVLGPVNDPRDRQVLRQPIALPEHIPVEQSAGCPAVAVYKWVHVGQHEVDDDAPDDGVDKGGRLARIEKAA